MKNFKFFAVMLMSASFAGAMDPAGPAASDAVMAGAPPIDHNVRVITLDIAGNTREIAFARAHIEQIDFLREMLVQAEQDGNGETIDVRTYTNSPFSRFEGLQHIPALIDCATKGDVENCLNKIGANEVCRVVGALHFFRVPHQVFLWAHAYVINRLGTDRAFGTSCLASPETRENLKIILSLESIGVLTKISATHPLFADILSAMNHGAPLFKHDVCVITIGGEVCFTPEQLMKLDFLYGMLEEEAPIEREKDIDLRKICAEIPCLCYEVLQHIPALVDCVTRTGVDHYLDEIAPEQACSAVLALHFLRAPQDIFEWVHAYVVERLVNDNPFTASYLSLSGTRKNLEHIIAFCDNESVPASIRSLRSMLLKNASCICSVGAFNFQLSPDGSRLAVQQIIDCAVALHQTSDCSKIKRILGNFPVFSPDGSMLAVERTIDGNKQVVLHRTIDGNEIGSPILEQKFVFSPTGSSLAVTQLISNNLYVVLHLTSGGSEIGNPILGYDPVFSPDGSRLAVNRINDDDSRHVALHLTSDGSEIGDPIFGVNPVFSPDGSKLTVKQKIDGNWRVVLHQTDNGSKIRDPILGVNPVFSPDSSRLAITRKINDNTYVVALHRISDGGEIRRILGADPVFSPDGSRLAVNRVIDGNCRVILHQTSDYSEIKHQPILGMDPVFSPDGSRLAVRQWIDDKRHVALYRTSDGSKIGNPILGYAPVFSPDGSLLKINFIIGGNTGQGLYFTDDGNALLQNVNNVRFGTNGTIVYQDGDRIACINPTNINSAEYVLALAAVHQGSDIDETTWVETFVDASEQVKAFVREKTGKFIP